MGAMLLCSLWTYAQTRLLQGRITDDQGQPAAFASVQFRKTHKGVSADPDGRFALQVKSGDVLVISGTGFESKEITITNQDRLDVSLSRKSTSMTEVVVTALGQTQQKARIGYATQTFNNTAITKNGVTGALDGLEGKIAGADISNTGGPGSSTKVVLRGYGVISGGSNQPLYVIDGVPMSDGQYQQSVMGTDGADFGNGMNNINPADIESITVLKGTAASSLYGGLAKNGAIIITTRRGRAGKLHVDYSGSANFSRVGKLPDMQKEFGQGWGGVFVSDENGSWGPRLDGVVRPWGAEVNGVSQEKPFSFVNNNIRDFYTTGTAYNNNLSLSGGTETNRFYFSYGNVTADGVVPGKSDQQQRNTFSLRTNSNYGRFSINTSFNYVNQKLNVPNTGQSTSSGGGVFESLLQIPVDIPIKSFKDYNSVYNNINNFFTPYAENPYFGVNENGNQQKLDRFFGNVDMNYKFTNALSAEFRLGGDFTDANTFIWKQKASALAGTWDGPDATNPEGSSRTPDIGQVTQGLDHFGIINGDLIVKYVTDLGSSFHLDALAGGNFYQSQTKSVSTTITNLLVPSFFNLSNTTSPAVPLDASFNQRRIGAYAQATLGYKDQLFLTGNIRNDWSSTLPINNNSIFYPGANLSWVASQLLGSNSAISFLKLRAAYGRTGSDPSPYLVLPSLGTGSVTLPYGTMTAPFNSIGAFGVNTTIGNQSLQPIFTNEFEVGAEARFLKDRIGLDVSLYDKKTKGQIFPVPIAPSSGYLYLVENLGTVGNKGIELTLNVKPVETRNFTWNFTYTFSRDWNKVLSLSGATQNPLLTSAYAVEMRAVVGKTVASIYGPVAAKTPNGQTIVDATTGYPTQNLQALDQFGNANGYYGTGLYTYMMGLSNTFTYKDFSLSGSLDFRYGGVMYSETADLSMFVGNSVVTTYNDRRPFIIPNSVNALTDASGKVTGYQENTTYIGGLGSGQSDNTWGYYYPTQNAGTASQMRMIDRSFLKLRDVNLTYTLPSHFATRIHASNAQIGVYGRNFLLWTPKNNVYVDPEATNLGNDLTGELGEFAAAPLTKEYGLILKLSF
ncbi:MAG TPA: SusC/RagA family TonB-linked outer membrane protein [Dinghuibacter sp.]|uniref:SusC/RagA family TonB-linked outer membrane protein n=1 Tax=Dinghuibacter sp. TaxID=2024697 RepID=UPI002D0E0ED5|nr:SusC/RagA family TonB-linked outer membrane protein [Dinghuibacter sp.]HTJ13844.1 SusC/RagA family TonB-linked outer membrane protein [Dinghuibacter sp.]